MALACGNGGGESETTSGPTTQGTQPTQATTGGSTEPTTTDTTASTTTTTGPGPTGAVTTDATSDATTTATSSTTGTTGTTGAAGLGFSLRFFGAGVAAPDLDRVKIPIDDPDNAEPGPPVDVGGEDFTIEWWMKAAAEDNTAGPVSCGANIDWIYGNIIIDRDRFNQDRKYGVSLAGGELVWGVSGDGTGDLTICSGVTLADGAWHHVALQRRFSDGRMWMHVDGALVAEGAGPSGDISYPDDGVPQDQCGGPCTNSDPFIVLAAEKHDAGAQYPSYSGWMDELRYSSALRYGAEPFAAPDAPFATDADTVALYHFDEGAWAVLTDTSMAPGGPSNGMLKVGGDPVGPQWSDDTPF